MSETRIPVERLQRLLGMLGSQYDAEVVNAARKVDLYLRNAGMTWGDLVPAQVVRPAETRPAETKPAEAPKAPPRREPIFTDLEVFEALQNSTILSERQKLQIWAYEQELRKGTLPERDLHYVRHVFRRAVVLRSQI